MAGGTEGGLGLGKQGASVQWGSAGSLQVALQGCLFWWRPVGVGSGEWKWRQPVWVP